MSGTLTAIPAPAPRFRINNHDRVSLILTLAATAVALIAGLALRGAVESRTKAYKTPEGVTIHYPDSWRLNTAGAASGIVSARDGAAQNFATTLELRVVSVDSAAKDGEALSFAVNQAALNRGQKQSNFKVFSLTSGQTIKGLPGATSSFVFVSDTSSTMQEGLPVVVLGDDTLVRKGGAVYIFSALSTEENHAQAISQLQAFVDSAQLP
ncbi:MAG TPA: hypothetical protein VGK81_09085 [Anaerolineae bacterium]|jgi:hypothetical protein